MPGEVTQLSANLWVVQSSLFHMNSGIFVAEGQACLLDPGVYPGEIGEIARFVEERGAAPQVIVLTHSHWDHILGPERFPGVRVVAQASYVPTMREFAYVPLKSINAWVQEESVPRDGPFEIPWPDDTFEESAALEVGGLTLRLMHAPGHATDQLVAYHKESATLWAADMLSDLEIPFVSDNLTAYRHTLDRLAALNVEALVPGHGQPTTDGAEIGRRLTEDIEYLAELQQRVEAALRGGKGLDETVAVCADMSYRNPAENRGPHRMNVESAYIELGGDADPSQVGWSQEWAE